MGILVLLGETNDSYGRLSKIAKSRCDAAIEFLRSNAEFKVLPTGAFGKHFNTSTVAHGRLLRNYLIEHGIRESRILPHTNSCGTEEDAFCARRSIEEFGCTEVVVLTSEFHMKRVKYIFNRVLPEYSVRFIEAESPVTKEEINCRQRNDEKKIGKLSRNWVEVPLYKKSSRFPAEIWQNASAEQKHYDTVSIAVLTGIFVVFGYPYTIDAPIENVWPGSTYFAAALLHIILWVFYIRFAYTAITARQVLQKIEVAFDCPGFSTTFQRRRSFKRAGTLCLINLLLSLMLIILFLSGLIMHFDVNCEITRMIQCPTF